MIAQAAVSMDRIFSEELEQLLLDHAGCWVAVVDDAIVAVGNDPAEVLGLATESGHPDVLLHHVPEHGKAYFF